MLKQLIRYWSVGVICFSIQFIVLICLVELGGLNPTLSSAIGSICAYIVNYWLLYYWTFRSKAKHHIASMMFLMVTTFGIAINLLIFWSLTEVAQVWYPISQFIATICSSLFNFAAHRKYTFNV